MMQSLRWPIKLVIILFAAGGFWVLLAYDANLWFGVIVVVFMYGSYRQMKGIVVNVRRRKFFTVARLAGHLYAVIGVLMLAFGLKQLVTQEADAATEASFDTGMQVFMHGNTIALIGLAGYVATRIVGHFMPNTQLVDLFELIEKPDDDEM